ncbi:MAG: TniQ family protein, partial [Cyanobacteria bacterium]|nr:TniQ family protein [Cyanobacteriota bacterium]
LGESISHFLGRFCRENHATLNQIGAKTSLGAVLGRWEKFRFNPPPTEIQVAALASLVRLEAEMIRQMLPSETIQIRAIRLCAACYVNEPYHRMEWQHKFASRCDRHALRLLLECPNCKTKFPIPSKWVKGDCKRCLTPFESMVSLQKPL